MDDVAARREWQRKLAEGGLAAVTWPADYGGQGLGPLHQVVLNQEIGRAGVPGICRRDRVGVLGPTMIAYGTEDQKQRHLGPMLHADEGWCQLFSEPAAGSDLAGIQCARGATRRRLDAQRPEGLDHPRPVRRLRPPARPHRPRRAQAPRPDHVRRATMHTPGRDRAPAAAGVGGRSSTRSSSTTCACRRTSRSATGRRRLGRVDDDADVRARGASARRRGLRLARRPLRQGARSATRRRSPTARCGTGSARSRPSSSPCASSATARCRRCSSGRIPGPEAALAR